VIGWSSRACLESLCSKLNPFAPAAPMSGKVKALVPINGLLLFSANSVGLERAGNFARALEGNDGEPPIVPDRLRADGD
jgi:hypothetical protein